MKTFVDAGVLIAAFRGGAGAGSLALDILDDPVRRFVTSDFVRLEVLPKAIFYKRKEEVAFYEAFFAAATCVRTSEGLFLQAFDEAKESGLSAVDALHVAAAKAEGCDDFQTSEEEGKPLFRVKGIAVRSIAR